MIIDPASKDGAIRWGGGAGLKEEVHRRKYSRSLLSSFRLSFVMARETTKHPAKSGWIQQRWSHQRRGKGEIQDGEKTALIVDPEGKDGAIKRGD